ncbi:MAG: hypothetical protein ABSE97_03190 [Verrucomicrobiota bacterium]|jgi:hypothetical protein
MLPRPPEYLVKKLIPILSKIIGISCIVSGAIFLPIGCILLFLHKENTTLIGAVFIGGSIISIALGFIVVRFVPRFMLGTSQSLRDN